MLAGSQKRNYIFRLFLVGILAAACLFMFSVPTSAWTCDTVIAQCIGDDVGETWALPWGPVFCMNVDITENALGDEDCMIIDAADVVLDCQGHSITGEGAGAGNGIGITVQTTNVTLYRCDVNNFEYGIYSNSSGPVNISHNEINVNTNGIRLRDDGGAVSDNTIHHNDIHDQTSYDIELVALGLGVTTNTIRDNEIYNGVFGISLTGADANVFRRNNIFTHTSNGVELMLGSDNNQFFNEVSNGSQNWGFSVTNSDNNLFSMCSATDNDYAFYSRDIGGNSAFNWLYNFSVYNAGTGATTKFSTALNVTGNGYSGQIAINDSNAPVVDGLAAGKNKLSSKALDLTNPGGVGARINDLHIHYTDAELCTANCDETTLELWRHNGAAWNLVAGSGITPPNVTADITAFSDFAPLADALCADGDGDGWDDCAIGACGDTDGLAADCDDTDAAINPGATEVECNAVDEDCDGLADDAPDADIDTYDTCDIAEAGDTDGLAADCDDANAAINPGATDQCGNGVDEDCSGADLKCPEDKSSKGGWSGAAPIPPVTCGESGHACCLPDLCNGTHYAMKDETCTSETICCKECMEPLVEVQESAQAIGDGGIITGETVEKQIIEGADPILLYVIIGGGIAIVGAVIMLIKSAS